MCVIAVWGFLHKQKVAGFYFLDDFNRLLNRGFLCVYVKLSCLLAFFAAAAAVGTA